MDKLTGSPLPAGALIGPNQIKDSPPVRHGE